MRKTASLVDSYGRTLDYVRLAVTDRCNLRCGYCMPECGIDFVPREELLTYEEMTRLLGVLSSAGVNKLRITGGEPFVRKGIMEFMEQIHTDKLFDETHITTNATLTSPYIDRFAEAGIKSVNISLDTLDRERFILISKRDKLNEILATIADLVERNIKIKINMVVMGGINDEDILPMALLAKDSPIEVRFLEEMPFNGSTDNNRKCYNHLDIKKRLDEEFGTLNPQPLVAGQTSTNYSVPGFKGNLGIIASFSRTFCGSCNRLRITPTGILKTCLYDDGKLDFRTYLRGGATDRDILIAVQNAVAHKAIDGHSAESQRLEKNIHESMAAIGG